MMVRVVRLWREGVQIPRWQHSQLVPAMGELRIEESRDELLRRFLRTAYLFDFTKHPHEVIPPLVDAAVLYIKGHTMSISGFERGDMLPTYAQTWLVEVLPQS